MKEIGGFFELELHKGVSFYPMATELGSARTCLAYFIRAKGIKKLNVPAYTCPVVWSALEAEQCEAEFYEIDSDFLPTKEFKKDEYVLYTNYFGLCTSQAEWMSSHYENLIIDNSQAFYSAPQGAASFYSPRKFFGVPDGGLLISNAHLDEMIPQDISLDRMIHLLKRIELGANAAYQDFKNSDKQLDNQPIKKMSNLTSFMLKGIDYEKTKQKRKQNFDFLHQTLGEKNIWKFSVRDDEVPLVYPFLPTEHGEDIKKKMIDNRIYTATYWPGQRDHAFGSVLERELVCLPIDQRYGIDEMAYILEKLK